MGIRMRRSAWLVILLGLLLGTVGLVPVHAESSVLGARDNPVPVGKPVLLTFDTVQEYVTVAEVNRGDTAWKRIHRYSADNLPPASGKEYLMALVVVRYIQGSREQAALSFHAISAQEITKDPSGIVHVRPDFEIDFTPDAMSGGWIIREVDPADPNPLLVVSLGQSDAPQTVYFSTIDNG